MNIDRLLFREVICRAYLRELHDGIHIVPVEDDKLGDNHHYYLYQDECRIRELSGPGDGGDKRYYEREKKRFKGVVVGIKEVTLEAKLILAETISRNGCTKKFVKKIPTVTEVCAVVYYGSLLRRYVSISDIIHPKLSEVDEREELSLEDIVYKTMSEDSDDMRDMLQNYLRQMRTDEDLRELKQAIQSFDIEELYVTLFDTFGDRLQVSEREKYIEMYSKLFNNKEYLKVLHDVYE